MAGLFDYEFHLEKLSKTQHTLSKLNEIVDWKKLREIIEKAPLQGYKKSHDRLMMFKILILQKYYNLTDEQTEFYIGDRLSFIDFLGLRIGDALPNEKIIRNFKRQLKKNDILEKLFELFTSKLASNGMTLSAGAMLEATLKQDKMPQSTQVQSQEENLNSKQENVTNSTDAENKQDDKTQILIDFSFLSGKQKELLKLIYQFKFNFNIIAEYTKIDANDILNMANKIALVCNSNFSSDIFKNISLLMEEYELIKIENLDFLREEGREYVFALMGIESFSNFYEYDEYLEGFILFDYNNIDTIQEKIELYLKEKHTFLLSYDELMQIINIKSKQTFATYIDKLQELKKLKFDAIEYIYLPLQYIFEEEINNTINELKKDQYSVLEHRFVQQETLADIGIKMELSKERVRQIEDKALKIFSIKIPKKFVVFLKNYISVRKVLDVNKLPIEDKTNKIFVINILRNKLNFIYDSTLNSFIDSKDFSHKNIVISLKNKIQNSIFSQEILVKNVKLLAPKANAYEIINILLKSNIIAKVKDNYFFSVGIKSKSSMVEFAYEINENGYSKKDYKLLYDTLETYFPKVFDTKSERSIFPFAENNPNIILWDWGRYIHIKYAKTALQEYDFGDVLHYLNSSFDEDEKISQIDLERYYKNNEEVLLDYGIISKYALYSLLKIKYPNEFTYKKSPRISRKGTQKTSLSEVLLNCMDEKRIYTIDELSDKLQTKKERIQQLIDREFDIVAVDKFKYMKKEDIYFPLHILEKIIKFINKTIDEMQFFYVGLLMDSFTKELECISKYNSEILLIELLKKNTLHKTYAISNTRIVHKDYKITRESLNFHFIVKTNLLADKSSISKDEMFEYFIKRGLSKNNVLLYYLHSKNKAIIRKDEENFILISSLDLSDDDIKKINTEILNKIDSKMNINDLIAITSPYLPKIKYKWNKYLLVDLLDSTIFNFDPNKSNPSYINIKSSSSPYITE